MAIDNELSAGGIPYPLAQEIIAATRGTPTSAVRISAMGVSGPLAIEMARQLNGGVRNPNGLVALGLSPAVANYIATFTSLRNLAVEARMNTQETTVSGGKTRHLARDVMTIINAKGGVRLRFDNWFMQGSSAAPEPAASNDIPISGVSVVTNGVPVQVKSGGSATFTVPAGVADFQTDEFFPADFGLSDWPFIMSLEQRVWYDLPNGAKWVCFTGSQRGNTSQCQRYAPAGGDTPEIMATGPFANRAGADFIPIFMPTMVLGRFSTPTKSFVSLRDSFGQGTGDTNFVNGMAAGIGRRAASALGAPMITAAAPGRTIGHYLTANAKVKTIFPYATSAENGLGTNDFNFLFNGVQLSADQMAANMARLINDQRAAGIRFVCVSDVVPRMNDGNFRCTDLANQVYFTTQAPGGLGFEAGGQKDLYNALLAANPAAVGADAIFRASLIAGDPGDMSRWKVGSFTTTTASALTVGQATLPLTAAAPAGSALAVEPGVANAETNYLFPLSYTGATGNLTVADAYSGNTLGSTVGKAHASGVTVRDTNSFDGTHPTAPMHVALAAGLATVLAGAPAAL